MNTSWIIGPRKFVEATDPKGKRIRRLGKNGGPVMVQSVTKVLTPRLV